MTVCATRALKKKQKSCLAFFFFDYLLSDIFISYLFPLCIESVNFFYEAVAALMAVKSKMKDQLHVLNGWDINSVYPCSWNMVAFSTEGFVVSL